MKSKGFTLIELLGVIVILAIIALITTPIILNIIDDARKKNVEISLGQYMKAVDIAIFSVNLDEQSTSLNPEKCKILDNGAKIDCFEHGQFPIETDGIKPTDGMIYFSNGEITKINITMPNGNTYGLDEYGNIVLAGSGEGTGDGEENPSVPQNLIPPGGLYYVNVTGPSLGNLEWTVTTAVTKYSAGDSFPISQSNDVYVYDGWVYIFGGSGSPSAGPSLTLEDGTIVFNVYTGSGDGWGAEKYSYSAGPMLTTLNGKRVLEINN